MKRNPLHITSLLVVLMSVGMVQAQTGKAPGQPGGPRPAVYDRHFFFTFGSNGVTAPRSLGFSPAPAGTREFSLAAMGGPNLPVMGSGTIGHLTRWMGFTTNSFVGDSTIYEDKYGKVGIGVDSPAFRLSVAGPIQSMNGGFVFPDGSIQTTAASGALSAVTHNATLTGAGTGGSPIGIAVPLQLTATLSASKILIVQNNGVDGTGVEATGRLVGVQGFGAEDINGGDGVRGDGGEGTSGVAGIGVRATGGRSETGTAGIGVRAVGGDAFGINGNGGDGVLAFAGTTFGGGGTSGHAGHFEGDVLIEGNLQVTGTKNFKIDHPLDPENKYLLHAAIESSEVLNVYSGNVVTDAAGDAVVVLPEWFEAVNSDFRYQLTVIGSFAQAIVASEIEDHKFVIKSSAPRVKVSWQVTGVRSDPAMLKHPFAAEQNKPELERGYYLVPEAYGQLEERGATWARYPEMMKQLKQQRSAGLDRTTAARVAGSNR